jgi:hypothetical protein
LKKPLKKPLRVCSRMVGMLMVSMPMVSMPMASMQELKQPISLLQIAMASVAGVADEKAGGKAEG